MITRDSAVVGKVDERRVFSRFVCGLSRLSPGTKRRRNGQLFRSVTRPEPRAVFGPWAREREGGVRGKGSIPKKNLEAAKLSNPSYRVIAD